MSRPFVTEVIETSPYRGEFLLLHLVIADTVDGSQVLRAAHWWLAERARVSRNTVTRFVRQALADGVLEVDGPGQRGTLDYRLVLSTRADVRGIDSARRADVRDGVAHESRTNRADVRGRRARAAHMVRDTSVSVDHRTSLAGAPARETAEMTTSQETDTPTPDPIATRVAQALGCPYLEARQTLDELRGEGIGDVVLDEVAGYCAGKEIRTLGYVTKVAHDWMHQRDPGWSGARTSGPRRVFGELA